MIFMAKKKKNKNKDKKNGHRGRKDKEALDYIRVPEIEVSSETKRSIFIILIIGFGILSFLSLLDSAGLVGTYLNQGLTLGFGWGSWIIPVLLVVWGVFSLRRSKNFFKGANYLGLFLFLISLQPLLHFFYSESEKQQAAQAGSGGGYAGMHLAYFFENILGFWGGLVILVCLLLISVLLMFNTSLIKVLGRESLLFKLLLPFRIITEKMFKRQYEDEEDEEEEESELPEEVPPVKTKEDVALEGSKSDVGFHKKDIEEKGHEEEEEGQQEEEEEDMSPTATDIQIDIPLSLLDNKVGKPISGNTKRNTYVIQKTLENFGIPVEMGESSIGPTITRYTFKPAEGIKLSRITTLSNDMALALAAHPIRIEAPIPGKALVGIEVPNKAKAIISLREVLASKNFKKDKGALKIALGRDVSGNTWVYDVTRMPHVLIAGATNSGKSVCINSVIVSLLYQHNPSDLRFVMIDPKRVELPVYNGIPHLLTPVVTDVKKTVNALKWCLNEMDRRFEILSQARKRDIASYNQTAEEKLPYIVIIIDELSDLMIAAGKEIEASIIRLTQMARAVGMHLIIATQRPSVDVITGLIKANVPARIAFSVASGVDSKTILDTTGAEKLIGQGDMLFTTAEFSMPKRIQGVYIGDSEIKRVINYIREKSGHFEYMDEVVQTQKVNGTSGTGLDDSANGSEDELFEEAKETVVSSGKASASFLQRKLSVGYARAARLIDELEEEGIVGPANGSKPREILVSKEEHESQKNETVSGTPLHNKEESQAPQSYFSHADDQEEEAEESEPENEEEDDSYDAEVPAEEEGYEEDSGEDEGDEEYDEDDNEEDSDQEEGAEEDFDEDDEDDEDDGLYFSK